MIFIPKNRKGDDVIVFILTDGKNYVMENEYKLGEYLPTTSPVFAKEFTFKQARSLLQNKKKSLAWIREYQAIDKETGENCYIRNYKGNGGSYMGNNDVDFDDGVIDLIYKEANSLMGMAGWSLMQIEIYEKELNMGLSKYDSALSDINHALQKYKEDNNGKKPQAHKMSKLGYMLDEVRDKRKHIKQCIRYVQVMKNAISNGYTLEKIKLELTKVKNADYKGRTEYYQKALDILN